MHCHKALARAVTVTALLRESAGHCQGSKKVQAQFKSTTSKYILVVVGLEASSWSFLHPKLKNLNTNETLNLEIETLEGLSSA
jgi:hypothetical protein